MLHKIKQLLNEQAALENQAHFTYLSMAIWSEMRGYEGAATFFYQQSQEERQHMLKVLRYLVQQDEQPDLPSTQTTKADYQDLQSLFVLSLQSEMALTSLIDKTLSVCLAEKDFRTFAFLQWFVEEQKEEENTMRAILQRFDMVKREGLELHALNQYLAQYARRVNDSD